MAFCADCDRGVHFDEQETCVGEHQDLIVYIYSCHHPDCANDGGKVWAKKSGGVVKEEGVW